LEPVNALKVKKFDMDRWANFTGGKQVKDIARANGKIWLATKGNLVKLDPQSGKMVFYNEANSGLPASWINTVAADSAGHLWLGFNAFYEIFRFRPSAGEQQRWTIFREQKYPAFSGNTIEYMIPAGNGGLWISHRSKFAYVSPDRQSIEIYDAYKGFEKNDQLQNVRGVDALAVGGDGSLWIAASSSHLVRFNRNESSWEAVKIGGEKNGHYDIEDMVIGPENTIWMAAEQGIIRYKEQQWNTYNRDNIDVPHYEPRLRDNTALHVHSIDASENGSLYAATEHGILVWKKGQWEYVFDFELVRDHEITSLLTENNRLWVGNNAYGLLELIPPDQAQRSESPKSFGAMMNGWKSKAYHCSPLKFRVDRASTLCASPDGSIWIANDFIHSYGAVNFHPDSAKVSGFDKVNSPLPGNDVYDIAVDAEGTPWFVTTEGIMHPEKNGSWRTYNPVNSGLPDDPTDIEIHPNGTVYAGTNKGLGIFDGQRWTADVPGMNVEKTTIAPDGSVWILSERKTARYNGSEWTVYDPTDGGVNTGNGLKSIYVDRNGDAWIGVDAIRSMGLARVSKNGRWKSFGDAPGSTVYGVAEDPNGNLWIGSWNGGLSRYMPEKTGRQAWQSFRPDNSPLPTENVIALEVDANGNIWMGNREGGLTVYNPDGLAF
ncbi:MAG: hypothetical protein GF313_14375, partial [Caldithrix sp.]|nr:hypothetical protein [Caldithrix sp.]